VKALLPAVLSLSLAGCFSISVEGSREGLPRAAIELHKLKTGSSTLREALQRLGPPDVLLRVGDVDRLYYVSWDGITYKFAISAPLPLGRSVSTDAFILGLGSEEFRLARLEFDRAGVLRDLQSGEFGASSHGEYIAIDNRIVETFLSDRSRAFGLIEEDDDDQDLDEPKRPPK
jgi:hypothetical protein